MVDPAFFGDYYFKFDTSKPLKDQAVYEKNGTFLLNVRKVFTNNVYFGVEFTCFDKINGITHRFRCKDRRFPNYTEKIVDNKDCFIASFEATKESSNIYHYYDYTTALKQEKQNFNYKNYEVYFMYKDNYYHHTQIKCLNSGFVQRGIYGAKTKDEEIDRIENHGYAVTTSVPILKDIDYLVAEAESAKANFIFTVSTEYSKIIVEREFQYRNDSFSEIKKLS